jgi:CBS domain containing-hemolysin-like protein
MRASGQRLAVVGSLAEPLGLLTLKDLVEEISGELGDW